MFGFCSKCKTEQPRSEFKTNPKNKSGLRSWCKSCDRESDRRRAKTPERKLVKKREKLKSRYGISDEKQLEMAKSQNFTCAISGCSSELKMDRNTHTDHCHYSKKVRGLLCADCNKALGLIKDNPIIASGMASYLLEHANA